MVTPISNMRPHGAQHRSMVVALLLVAMNLRPAVAAVPAVLSELTAELRLSSVAVAAVLTLPTVGLALFSFVGPVVVRRAYEEQLVSAGAVAILVGDSARLIDRFWPFLAGTVLIAIGTGLITSVIPGLVKRNHPDRVAVVMAAYSAVLTIGAAASAAAAPAIVQGFGCPATVSVGVCTIGPVSAATAVWWLAVRRGGVPRRPRTAPTAASVDLWRNPLGWWVTGYFALIGFIYYVLLNWMPTFARSRGMSPADAGAALAAMSVAQIAGALLVPLLIGRRGDQRPAAVVIAVTQVVGSLALLFSNAPAGLWLGAVIVGVGLGSGFGLAMTFIGLRAGDEMVALRLSAMAQGAGYAIAAAGPPLAGALHDAAGGWTAVIGAVIAVMVAAGVFGVRAGVARTIGGAKPTSAPAMVNER